MFFFSQLQRRAQSEVNLQLQHFYELNITLVSSSEKITSSTYYFACITWRWRLLSFVVTPLRSGLVPPFTCRWYSSEYTHGISFDGLQLPKSTSHCDIFWTHRALYQFDSFYQWKKYNMFSGRLLLPTSGLITTKTHNKCFFNQPWYWWWSLPKHVGILSFFYAFMLTRTEFI